MSSGKFKSGAPKSGANAPSQVRKAVKNAAPMMPEAAPVMAEPPFMPVAEASLETPALDTAMAAAMPSIELSASVHEAVEQFDAAADQISNTIEQGAETMTDLNQNFETANQAAGVASDRMQAAFGDMNQRAKAAVEKSSKMFEEATELTKGNVEALVASSKIAAKGVESLGQNAADYGRRSFEEASAVLKSFADVKSPTELFRLQSDYARSAFDSMVAEASKVSETMIKLAGDVAEPLTSRYAVAADRVKTLAA